jgi:lipopolysaccharide transport system permease protein
LSRIKSEWLREFWHYRELFFFMVWRDIKIRYKQTVLGAVWAVVQPFVTMIIFTIIFGKVAGMSSDDLPHPIFYYCGMLPWTYFAGALRYSGNSLVENANLIRKVYFPRAILPASSILGGLVDFAIASVIFVLLLFYYKVPFTWELLLCPLMILPLMLLALGVGMLLAALNVRYRDVKHAIPFIIQLWFFGSAIIYPLSSIAEKLGEQFATLMAYNPVSGIVESFRAAVSPQRSIQWETASGSLLVIAVLLVIGTVYFRKAEKDFADTI